LPATPNPLPFFSYSRLNHQVFPAKPIQAAYSRRRKPQALKPAGSYQPGILPSFQRQTLPLYIHHKSTHKKLKNNLFKTITKRKSLNSFETKNQLALPMLDTHHLLQEYFRHSFNHNQFTALQ